MMSFAVFFLLGLMLLVPTSATDEPWVRDIKNKMATINADNCHVQPDLSLRPRPFDMLKQDRFKRMSLAVLNRAFFFSYILQKLNQTFYDFQSLPNLDYYYLSASTAVASVPQALASGVYYDKNTMYPNFDRALYFNQTYPLFGVRSVRTDLQNAFDLMSIADSGNYTTRAAKKYTPWYWIYLPDPKGDYFNQQFYTVAKTKATGETELTAIRAPLSDNGFDFTMPYFDCGRTNKWITTAVSPITDVLPRYTGYAYLRRSRTVAVAAMDIEFDLNQIDAGTERPKVSIADQFSDQMKGMFVNHLRNVNPGNCGSLPDHNLTIHERVFEGRNEVFPHQLRTAERLANFISGILRTRSLGLESAAGDVFPIDKQQILGEVIAAVMADDLIVRTGIYFERDEAGLLATEYFAPVAWRERDQYGVDQFKVKDMAEEMNLAGGHNYTEEDTFQLYKNGAPKKFSFEHILTGAAATGSYRSRSLDPGMSKEGMIYPAVAPDTGTQGNVYFDCGGLGEWLWNYTVPFARLLNLNERTQTFAGLVTVTIRLSPDDFI
ncbi:uncharacterized protein LOC135492864 [Lineus longissimus]|uniref:uncharacterized protein LOC135492864 n=1 Tax=Lineus longissimus TaxID=88925 RepID=UPI00315C6292